MARQAWLDSTPYDWLERNLLWLGKTMLAGAIGDAILALAGCLFPAKLAAWIGLAGPAGVLAVYWWAMVHLVLGCFCILAWMDIKRNIVIVTGAIIVRVSYAAFGLAATLLLRAGTFWAIVGGVSLLLAIVHYALLRLSDFGFWEVLYRAGNPPGFTRRTGRRGGREADDSEGV